MIGTQKSERATPTAVQWLQPHPYNLHFRVATLIDVGKGHSGLS